MSAELLIGLAAVAVIIGAFCSALAGGFAFMEGDWDGAHRYRGRSDESLLYGPIREAIYQFAYTRRVARQERIEAIRAERREKGLN